MRDSVIQMQLTKLTRDIEALSFRIVQLFTGLQTIANNYSVLTRVLDKAGILSPEKFQEAAKELEDEAKKAMEEARGKEETKPAEAPK